MFNLHQLEVFVACVECGSFSAAGRTLGKAQSAISTSINNLEIDTGLQLFDRNTRKPSLTPHGELLYRQAQNLLTRVEEVHQLINALSGEAEDKLTVAVSDVLLTDDFCTVVKEFSQHFPHTEVTLEILPDDQIAQRVSDGEANVGFMLSKGIVPQALEFGLVGYLSLCVASGHRHTLCQSPTVTIDDLENYHQILLTGTEGVWSTRISPKITRTNQIANMVALMEHNTGWGLLPTYIVERNNGLSVVNIETEDLNNWLMNIDRVLLKGGRKGPALSWLTEQSTKMFSSLNKPQYK